MKNSGFGARTAKRFGEPTGVLDLKRCRELGEKYIEASVGYTDAEMLYTLQELAKVIDKKAGGIFFERIRAEGGTDV